MITLPYQDWDVIGHTEIKDMESRLVVNVKVVQGREPLPNETRKYYAITGETYSGLALYEADSIDTVYQLAYTLAATRLGERVAAWKGEQAKLALIAPDGGKKK